MPKTEPSTAARSGELLERMRQHEFHEGDEDSLGQCDECPEPETEEEEEKAMLKGRAGLYRKTSYEYDEYECLCEKHCIAKMDDDEAMWASIGDEEGESSNSAGKGIYE